MSALFEIWNIIHLFIFATYPMSFINKNPTVATTFYIKSRALACFECHNRGFGKKEAHQCGDDTRWHPVFEEIYVT